MKDPDASLGKAVNSGVSWSLITSLLGQIINVAITIGLSRLLEPQDYGLVAIAVSISSLIETLGGVGVTAAVTQRATLTDQLLTGVVMILLSSGLLMVVAFLLLASPLALFYGQPELSTIMYVFCLMVPINLLQSVPLAILQRKLHFNKIASITFLSTLLSGGIALYLAYTGMSWQALIIKTLLFQLSQTICYCLLAWPDFRWKPSLSEVKTLLNFGVPQSLTQFVLLLGRRVDDILIGKWMGSSALGIYSMAYSLYLWPITTIKGRIAQVIFPALAKVQHDTTAIRFYYLRLISLSVHLGYPVIFGFIAISDLLVISVMGEKWLEVIPILRLLGLASLFEICISPGVVYQAMARTDLYLKNILITRGLAIAGIVLALPFGLQAVGLSLLISSFVSFFLYNYYIGKLIPLSNQDVVKALVRGALHSGAMCLVVVATRWLALDSFSPLAQLFFSITTGVLFYILVVYFFYRPLFNSILSKIKQYSPGALF